jgi:Tc5 transposase DNA-binding domain
MAKAQTRLSEAQKSAVCDYHKKNPHLKYKQVGIWAKKEFKLPTAPDRTTIARIVKDSTRYESVQPQNRRLLKARVIPFKELEEAMAGWVLQMEHRRICLSDDLIQKKALQFAERMNIPAEKFKASNGWLANFKKRNALKQYRIHGESGSAHMDGIEEQLQILRAKISTYDHDNVYNMDETGLFYNLAPDTTIASRQIEGLTFKIWCF